MCFITGKRSRADSQAQKVGETNKVGKISLTGTEANDQDPYFIPGMMDGEPFVIQMNKSIERARWAN